MNERKLKEAFKVALAMVIAYGISMQYNWFEPAWAGIGISMVALPNLSIKQSYRRGLLRWAGTIIGGIAGLIILALAPQNRFLFMLLISLWVAVTIYFISADKKHGFTWNVMGFTAVMIVMAGASNSENAFEHAMYRIMEDVLGVGIYTLISFLIWPDLDNKEKNSSTTKSHKIPLDRDYLQVALFGFVATLGGFLIWLFINPPGHSSWYLYPAIFAMALSGTPQLKSKSLLKYIFVINATNFFIYTLLLPSLSSFYTLGIFLFVYVFISHYLYAGFAYVFASFALLQLGITNTQPAYNFEAFINTELFMFFAVFWMIVVSHILRSSRPEKEVIAKVHQIMKSGAYLIAKNNEEVKSYQIFQKVGLFLARRDVEVLPDRLIQWINAIDFDLFTGVDKNSLLKLSETLKVYAHHMIDDSSIITDKFEMENDRIYQQIKDEYDQVNWSELKEERFQ